MDTEQFSQLGQCVSALLSGAARAGHRLWQSAEGTYDLCTSWLLSAHAKFAHMKRSKGVKLRALKVILWTRLKLLHTGRR